MSKNTNLSFLTDYITADIINGRIGIFTASPTVAFDVTGATKVSGILTLGSTISNGTYAYTLPSATGTLALTSDLTGYLPLTGGTLTGTLNGTSASFADDVTVNGLNIGNGGGSVSTNTAIGHNTLIANTTGLANTAVGFNALNVNTVANFVTAVGVGSLQNNISGNNNSALGYVSLSANISGNNNSAFGNLSLTANTTGSSNTAIGYSALTDSISGNNNVGIGYGSGGGITTGSGNTVLGANVAGLAAGLTNNIILANGTGAIKAQHDGTDWALTGKVGIGTTNPTTPLHVAGITQIVESGNTAFYGGNYVRLFGDPSYSFRNSAGSIRGIINTTSGNFSLYNSSNVLVNQIATAGNSYFNGGNVGIGTSSPTAKLMVSGGTTLPLLITNTTAASNLVSWISLRQGDTNTYGADIGIDTTTGGDFYISRVESGTATEAFRIARATGAATFSSTGSFGNASLNGAYLVVKGANGVPASSGTTTTAVFRISSGTGLYNVLDFGTNESSDYSWIQSTRANSLGTYDYLAIQPNGGNLLVGTLTNSTYKLDVNGTARVSGAATFSGSVNVVNSTDFGNESTYTNSILSIGNPSYPTSIRSYRYGGSYLNGLDFYYNDGTPKLGMRITSVGNVGIGTDSPSAKLQIHTAINAGNPEVAAFLVNKSTTTNTEVRLAFAANTNDDISTGRYSYISAKNTSGSNGQDLVFATNATGASATPRLTITSGGDVLLGANSFPAGERMMIQKSEAASLGLDRRGSDGGILRFYHDGAEEGNVTISGTTVSYNGGHLSRWSQTESNERIEGLVKGTVMSNLDQMAVWINPETGEPYENEQLNCIKISDIEGDKNVAGVFVNWDNDDQIYTNDINIAMTGDMIIRIAEGIVVEKGDLLISAGDGTAKPQSDDLIRSNTIAKVTSNHVTCVYEDGSYCVPCVLMAC